MRAFIGSIVIGLSILGGQRADAADLGIGERGVIIRDYVDAERAGALIIYDYEPGIVQRAYWLSPWRGRHYFPFHAEKVRQVPAGRPKPAEPYFRYWSNDGAMIYAPPTDALRSFGSTSPRRNDRVRADTAPANNKAERDSAAPLFE